MISKFSIGEFIQPGAISGCGSALFFYAFTLPRELLSIIAMLMVSFPLNEMCLTKSTILFFKEAYFHVCNMNSLIQKKKKLPIEYEIIFLEFV